MSSTQESMQEIKEAATEYSRAVKRMDSASTQLARIIRDALVPVFESEPGLDTLTAVIAEHPYERKIICGIFGDGQLTLSYNFLTAYTPGSSIDVNRVRRKIRKALPKGINKTLLSRVYGRNCEIAVSDTNAYDEEDAPGPEGVSLAVCVTNFDIGAEWEA